LGIETFADKYSILRDECLTLKEQTSKLTHRLSFYKEKSLRLDETMIANDQQIERLQGVNNSLEETIDDIKGEMQEVIDKYRHKKRKIYTLQDKIQQIQKANTTNIVIAVIATLISSYLLNLFI
jgi:predicted  nucleic acid-binding Zn-ribbon protein